MTDRVPAPAWFSHAISRPMASHFVDVAGTAIHYLSWNAQEVEKPGLLFAHGFRAHARWWAFVAPYFLDRYRVVALDFAGMGDSGNRADYDPLLFVRDIVGVIEHAGLGKTTLVGHSFGGGRVVRACTDFPQHVERAVIIDSFLPVPEITRRAPAPLQLKPKRAYPTLEAARERFRLVPEQNCAAPYVLDYVGRHSLKTSDEGWTWKFDDGFLARQFEPNAGWAAEFLQRIEVPVTFIYGDLSVVVTHEHAHAIVKHLRHGHGPIGIPESHHHVMLDQPLSLVAALRATLY